MNRTLLDDAIKLKPSDKRIRIFSVNLTKSIGKCEFCHTYQIIFRKLHFFVQWLKQSLSCRIFSEPLLFYL